MGGNGRGQQALSERASAQGRKEGFSILLSFLRGISCFSGFSFILDENVPA